MTEDELRKIEDRTCYPFKGIIEHFAQLIRDQHALISEVRRQAQEIEALREELQKTNTVKQRLIKSGDHHTRKKMTKLAIKQRRSDHLWGVVNPGNAYCSGVFRTLREAKEHRRHHASAYVVVRVIVSPDYGAEYVHRNKPKATIINIQRPADAPESE